MANVHTQALALSRNRIDSRLLSNVCYFFINSTHISSIRLWYVPVWFLPHVLRVHLYWFIVPNVIWLSYKIHFSLQVIVIFGNIFWNVTVYGTFLFQWKITNPGIHEATPIPRNISITSLNAKFIFLQFLSHFS